MAAPERDPAVPRVFVSYTSDDKEWVERLAARMRVDGIDVTLDRGLPSHAEEFLARIEHAVRERYFLIAICTPRFKESSEANADWVRAELDIATRPFGGGEKRKLIPVLRRGRWTEAVPTWLSERVVIDLRGDRYPESGYQELLRTLRASGGPAPPDDGAVPDFFQDEGEGALRSRVEWLAREAGFEDAFFSRYLGPNKTAFRRWLNDSAPLPSGAAADLRALWRTVQHLLSFLNFDSQRVKTMLQHRVPGAPTGQGTQVAPPWAGSSLVDYLKEHGPHVLSEVDRWVTGLRFGDPYAGILARTPHLQTAHAD